MTDAVNTPVGVNPNESSVARVYDYLLGGKDNYEIDRRVATEIARRMPEAPQAALENRNFLIRVCRFLAFNAGVRQYIDCGSGLPTTENVHQVVQRAQAEAKVVYVDYDPVVASHGRALLDENDFTEYLQADFFDPPSILDHPTVRDHLDWDEPIAVLFIAALHHHKGDRNLPADVTKQFIDRLPSGSYLAITHLLDPHDGSADDETVQDLVEVIRNGSMKDVTSRTRDEIEELFHGLPLVPTGPGQPAEIVSVAQWWPDGPLLGDPTIAQRILACGVARKP
ncbi:SAM-dependent methyltransferase [Amycolatopsis jejuensis]|uniref:SAM-dependent methyltransferase n=1 Tax=Amycolatopsis jejuensis TaxID=330084 RepID=UPI00068F0DBD|nr:SAM-dependent methyltransferase [Amycolatopsis jejuensis]